MKWAGRPCAKLLRVVLPLHRARPLGSQSQDALRTDCHDCCVVISDMGQFVGDHADQFLPREAAQGAEVTATAAFAGLRPVAKAIGYGVSIR